LRWTVCPDGPVVVRLPEQLFPLHEAEPLRVAVRPSAPVAVADREQLLPEQLPVAPNEFVPRGPLTEPLRSQADASATIESARRPLRAAVVIMLFI